MISVIVFVAGVAVGHFVVPMIVDWVKGKATPSA